MESKIEIVMLPVNQIMPYWRNPRHNDKTVDALVEVIQERGFNVPIVVDKKHVVVKGHARLKAAKRLGMQEVPCIITENDDAVNKLDRIKDNEIQELSRWNVAKLDTELERLNQEGLNKLFHPEDFVIHEEIEIPELDYQPTGIDMSGFDFSDTPSNVEQKESIPSVSSDTPYVPEKKIFKALCPYCGKVVSIEL